MFWFMWPQEIHTLQTAMDCSDLTHWGRVMHICISKLTIIVSDGGLSPGRRQTIIWTNAVLLPTGPLGTNFSEILNEIYILSFKKMQSKMSGNWRPFCLDRNALGNDMTPLKLIVIPELIWISAEDKPIYLYWWWVCSDSGYGCLPTRQQAIAFTSADRDPWQKPFDVIWPHSLNSSMPSSIYKHK